MTTERRRTTDYRLQLLQEMRCQNYDMIRFASYRTACKLRYVQKKVFCKLQIYKIKIILNKYYNLNRY